MVQSRKKTSTPKSDSRHSGSSIVEPVETLNEIAGHDHSWAYTVCGCCAVECTECPMSATTQFVPS